MRQSDCTGYVIARRSLKDNDRIIVIFTLEQGKISLIAKGIKKPRAKLQAHTEPLVETRFSYIGKGKLPTLVAARTQALNIFFEAKLEARLMALLITEVLDLITIEAQPNNTLYHCYKSSLEEIGRGSNVLLTATFALLGMMKYSGLAPDIRGIKGHSKYYFNMTDGRVASSKTNIDAIVISPDAVKLWSICTNYNISTCLRLKLENRTLVESLSLLLGYLQYSFDRKIKSIKVISESTELLHA